MNPFIQQFSAEFSGVLEHAKKDFSHIRTGQANPDILDAVFVEAYGAMTPLKQVASITVPEPKLIVIQPWDKNVLKDIEKAIIAANLGINPVNDGNVIRLPMPMMSEENRRDLVKIVKEKAEKARVSMRQIREKVKEAIQASESEGEISEDDKFKYLKELDKHTTDLTNSITDLAEKKSEQIMKI